MSNNELLKQIPKVDDMINNEKLAEVATGMGRQIVLEAIREVIDEIRSEIINLEEVSPDSLNLNRMLEKIISRALLKNEMNLKKVVNATGVVLHTNLGRAPLSRQAWSRVSEAACGYSTLEYNVDTGERGSRYDHVSELITKTTGAEAALVVNNNAASVLLILSTIAKGKSVVASRGELVEIGESFRIPDIMEQSGAKMVEVGTTNKTRLSDYKKHIFEETGALLKVHTSNYRIVGFTEAVELKDLVDLGKSRNIPVIHDLGSGALLDLGKYGIHGESTARESISAGADVVCFSGDKLLGGPQAGIIAGRKDLIDKMRKNPLTRALRIDKLTLAALEATLRLYTDLEGVIDSVPALAMITMPYDLLCNRAECLYGLLAENVRNCGFYLEDGSSQVGGGALPLAELPTRLIKVKPENLSLQELEERLRKSKPPVISRIHKDYVCLDVRTVSDEDFSLIVNAFIEIMN